MYGGDRSFINEAAADAVDLIFWNKGRYRLMVYHFGPESVDVAHMLVGNQDGPIAVEIVDVGGIPDFGEDELTRIIRDIVIDQILEGDRYLILPEHIRPEMNYGEEAKASENEQRLWGLAENLKTWVIFRKSAENWQPRSPKENVSEETGLLYFFDRDKNRVVEKSADVVFFTLSDIYSQVFSKIAESVEICQGFFLADEKDTERQMADLPLHILLSGQYWDVPLLTDVFECFKEGRKPVWDGKNPKWREQDKSEILRRHAEATAPLMYDHLVFSDGREGSVALGAARCWMLEKKENADFGGMNYTTRSRFGLGVRFGIGIRKFEEWIPRNRKLVRSDDVAEESDPPASPEMAVAEKDDFKFRFDKNGLLVLPVKVYEHLGRGDSMDRSNCFLIGRYDLRRPEGCSETSPTGKLRIEVTTDLDVRVRARIGGRWYEAFKC